MNSHELSAAVNLPLVSEAIYFMCQVLCNWPIPQCFEDFFCGSYLKTFQDFSSLLQKLWRVGFSFTHKGSVVVKFLHFPYPTGKLFSLFFF